MSKKTKRQVRKTTGTTATAAAPITITSTNGNGSRPVDKEFNPDYSAVIKDLKRIGTLAGSFFVLLIVLAFFLR
jgi:hypothetical protein